MTTISYIHTVHLVDGLRSDLLGQLKSLAKSLEFETVAKILFLAGGCTS